MTPPAPPGGTVLRRRRRRSSGLEGSVASSDGVTVRTLPAAERDAAGRAWIELEEQVGNTGLACGWDWTETWLDAYGPVVPHAFAVAERDGAGACGIALVARGTGRSGALAIHRVHLGTAGEPRGQGINVEYNRLLVAEDVRAPFARALVTTLLRDPSWDELALDGFAPEDAGPLLRALPALEPRRRASPYMDLRAVSEHGGDVLALVSSGTRRRVKRGIRGFGAVEAEWAQSTESALAILDDLAGLHQRRWVAAGERGSFAAERFRAFHRALVKRLLPKGSVALFRLRGPGGTIGCVYGLVERGRLLFYQSGFASFDDNKLRPGLVTHALCMQAAADHGLVAYDFLPGDSRYKLELSNSSTDLVWARARRPSLKARVVDGQRWLKRAVRELRA